MVPITAADPLPASTFWINAMVTVPTGSPPTSLESADLITGTSSVALAGDVVTVPYVGVS